MSKEITGGRIVTYAVAFLWAIKSEQFDDLEGPAHAILMDDDSPDTNEFSTDTAKHGQARTTQK